MTNKSALKGGVFERKIKDILTATYGISFERVPSSGALPYLKGDIFPPHHMHLWPYTVECKHYKELSFTNLLTSSSSDIHSFWRQSLAEAKTMTDKTNRLYYPMLIFRWNRSKDYIAWNTEFNCKNQFSISSFNLQYKIALLEDFLKENVDLKNNFK